MAADMPVVAQQAVPPVVDTPDDKPPPLVPVGAAGIRRQVWST